MDAVEKYTLMRGAGFTHTQAVRFINKGVKPHLGTKAKQKAFSQLTKAQGETSGKKSV